MKTFIQILIFLAATLAALGQTTPVRNPQLQGSGQVPVGSTLAVNGTLNGTGTFNFGSGTVVLPQNGATSGQVLKWNGSAWAPAADTGGGGSITLAGVPDYITIAGDIITRGLIDLTTDVTGTLPDGQVASTLARDSEVSASISALASVYQPLDADLTSLAALTTQAFGLSLLTQADATAARSTLGLGSLATQSGTFSGTSSGTNTGDQTPASLGLVIGTNVQAYDADLTTWAGVTPGTGIATALAINTGSAGAPVLFNGAGGTPSSLTLTNATGLPSTGVAAATLVIESEGIASNDNDTTLPTSAAVRDYVDGISGKRDVWMIAISDETTALTTGTAKATFRAPRAATVTAVRAGLTTVSSSGTPTFDINEAGTTILSTKLTVDASEKTSTTAATAAVISDTALADDAEITIDIDTAGTGATGAKVFIYVTY